MSIKGLKIGIPIEYHCEYLSADVLDVWDEVANLLEESGAIVKEVQKYNKHSISLYIQGAMYCKADVVTNL